MITSLINNFKPIQIFLNYIFKKLLGDYILNELDISKMQVELENKQYFGLQDIELNTYGINLKHLINSPIKILEGKIKKLMIHIPKDFINDKIQVVLEDCSILLMPIHNFKKNSNPKSFNLKTVVQNDNLDETSIISNIVNSALENFEIVAKNICIKLTTYEFLKISKDNPTITTLISKISFTNSNETNPTGLFLLNKQLAIENFCIKISNKLNYDEDKFFYSCGVADDKQIFKYLCDNSSIFSINYVNECSLVLKFSENIEKGKENEKGMLISMEVGICEMILNPLQLQLIFNFIEVCSIIFNETKNINDEIGLQDIILNNKKEKLIESVKNSKVIKILNSKIHNISIQFKMDLLNIICLEKKSMNEYPKLWMFYNELYGINFNTEESIKKFYCYYEDNYFIINMRNFQFQSDNNLQQSTQSMNISIYDFSINYINYKSKQQKKKNITKLDFNKLNNSRLMNNNMNNIYTSSKGSIYQSKISNNNNTSIYQSAIGSVGGIGNSISNKSEIFESVMESNANKFEGVNMDMFKSAKDDDVLIDFFNQLIDYDFNFIEVNLLKIKDVANDKEDLNLLNIANITNDLKSINYSKLLEEEDDDHEEESKNKDKDSKEGKENKDSKEKKDSTENKEKEGIFCYTLKNTIQSIDDQTNSGYISEEFFALVDIPKIFIEFHPALLYKLSKLFNNNLLLINEIMFYNLNIGNKGSFIVQDNREKDIKKDTKTMKDIIKDLANDNDLLNKFELVEKNSKKIFFRNKITSIKLSNFRSENFNQFSENYYSNNIESITNNLWINKKIESNDINFSLNEITERNSIKISIHNFEVMIKQKQRRNQNEDKIGMNIGGMEVDYYFNNDSQPIPIVIYTNLKDKSEIIKLSEVKDKKDNLIFFTEGSIESHNKSEIKNKNSLESLFNNSKIKFKKWNLTINKRSINLVKDNTASVLQDLRDCFRQKIEYSNLNDNEIDKLLDFSQLNNKKKEKSINFISISGKLYHLNCFIDYKVLTQLDAFFDTFSYSITLLQIFNKTQKNIYSIMKQIIFRAYSLSQPNQILDMNSNISNNADDKIELKYILINIELEAINTVLYARLRPQRSIDINKKTEKSNNNLKQNNLKQLIKNLFNKMEVPFFKLKVENIVFNNVIINKSLNKIGVFIGDLKCMLKKKLPDMDLAEILNNTGNTENEYETFFSKLSYDELNFNYLVYKGNNSPNSNLIRVDILLHNSDKVVISNNDDHLRKFFEDQIFEYIGSNDNYLYQSFEDYVKQNLLPLDDSFLQLGVSLNEIVICPLYNDFNIKYFLELKKLIIENLDVISIEKLKDKFNLYATNKVDILFNFQAVLVTLDLFSYFSDSETNSVLDNKMRMLINLENILYEENFLNNKKNLTLRLERLYLLFLFNLNHKGVANILVNKLQSTTIESSILKSYGFAEIINIDYLEMLNSTNLDNKDKDYKLLMRTVEVNFCRDSFDYILQFVNKINDLSNELKDKFKSKVVEGCIVDGNELKKERFYISDFVLTDIKEVKDEKEGNKILYSEKDLVEKININDIKEKVKISIFFPQLTLNLFGGMDFSFHLEDKEDYMFVNEENISIYNKEHVSQLGSYFNTTLQINNSFWSQPSVISDNIIIVDDFLLKQKKKDKKDKLKNQRRRVFKRNYYEHIVFYVHAIELQFIYDK